MFFTRSLKPNLIGYSHKSHVSIYVMESMIFFNNYIFFHFFPLLSSIIFSMILHKDVLYKEDEKPRN